MVGLVGCSQFRPVEDRDATLTASPFIAFSTAVFAISLFSAGHFKVFATSASFLTASTGITLIFVLPTFAISSIFTTLLNPF